MTNGELAGEKESADVESRCPSSVAEPGIYVFGDKKLCNVYHECECVSDNSTQCSFVQTNVCAIGTVFLNATGRCEPIELHGCDSSYLQSVSTGPAKNTSLDRDEEKRAFSLAESVNITGITDFRCPQGANDRFPDSQVCNLFHVCVSRAGQTFDQPFLCPFSTIFRYVDSATMYCDKRNKNDCVGKAFYQSDDNESILEKSVLVASNNNASHCFNTNEVLEDKLFCNVYHVCRDGRDIAYMCDNQLLFNPLSQICDYPINVVCYNKKIFKLADKELKKSVFSAPLIMTKTNNLTPSTNLFKKNGSLVQIYQAKFRLECPNSTEMRNYVIEDKIFCNVYHECYGDTGNAYVCGKNEAFETKVGACAPEHLVDCSGKLVLTESGQRAAKHPENKMNVNFKRMGSGEELVSGIGFDCRGRPNGHWRDTQFCDVFHACVNNEQKKTYSCAQLGGQRTYFDEETRRCEFVKTGSVSPCATNSFFKSAPSSESASMGGAKSAGQVVSRESSEGWRQFIRGRESFSCASRMDGFYASRWCNVFYRCFLGVKTEFLCPKMINSDRLWWVQHGSSQETPQTSAACVWPCETKKKCSSPGGSIVEVGDGKYDESGDEAERVWRISNCAGDSGLDDVFRLADADKSCQGQPEGAFFASQYCNVFHRCNNGKRKDFQCPKATNTPYDLWWNDEKSQCDWPCKVNCNKQIYASEKSALQIQNEDRSLNEVECRTSKLFDTKSFNFGQKNNYNTINNNNDNRHSFIRYNNPTTTATTTTTTTTTATTTTTIRRIDTKQIIGALPDENFVCLNSDGLLMSSQYCNVFYDCRRGQVSAAFYCDQGYFDSTTKSCVPSTHVQCASNPQLMYPFVAMIEQSQLEDIGCSNSIGSYIIHSNRFCNIYYVCDGRSTKPTTHRCYDRDKMHDAVFNREMRRCESKTNGEGKCEGEILPIKIRYQSSPIDYSKYVDLEPLSCRADQQYLAEHDKYCNLYHSCILGKYQMYACVTIGSFDKTSYFYYTNGDCAAPNADQCGPNKAIYPYEKLFLSNQSGGADNNSGRYAPVISPSLSYKGQSSYSSISLKAVLPYTPVCSMQPSKYLIPSGKYCNVFFECVNGKITTFACIDSTTGLFSGIFDASIRACKPYNQIDCPSNSLYTPEFDNGLHNEVIV